jgi:anti-anti-sigma regulatory factor
MTLRIITEQDAEGHVVRLAGRLDGEGTVALTDVLAGLPSPARLDCADLRSADEAGLEALRALPIRGIRLTGLSPYWRLRLAEP